MKPRVVLFGGTGYVGRAIKAALEARGAEVRVIKAPRFPPVLDTEIRSIIEARRDRITARAADISSAVAVVNAAGLAAPGSRDRRRLAAANALTPAFIAATAKAAGVPRFVHVSSAAVQGRIPVLDDTGSRHPKTPYAASKALAETLILELGPRESIAFRPASVHDGGRAGTKRLVRFARSRLSAVAYPGTRNTPQAQLENVADAVAFLALTPSVPPPIVHMPSEAISTAQLLEELGGHPPRLLPISFVGSIIAILRVLGALSPALLALARRLEIVLVGQGQATSWLDSIGWTGVHGVDGWRAIARQGSPADLGRPLRVVIISTVHARNDTRVFSREADMVARISGLDLTAVVADGLGDERREQYKVKDLGKAPLGRFGRFTVSNTRAMAYLLRARPDVVHFHSPDLIPACFIMTFLGSKVVYDVHELVAKDILDKHWIPPRLRRPTACIVNQVQHVLSSRYSCIIAATPAIADTFRKQNVVCIQNYPRLTEFRFADQWSDAYTERSDFLYLGSVTSIRGLTEAVQAVGMLRSHPECHLVIAGDISPVEYGMTLESLDGWRRTIYRGYVHREGLADLFANAIAGIVTFHPAPNHLDARPNKLFEYMAAGIPVIASNFRSWTELVQSIGCGLLVDPLNPEDICAAMAKLRADPQLARSMGIRGRNAVLTSLNWESEEKKLEQLYRQLMTQRR